MSKKQYIPIPVDRFRKDVKRVTALRKIVEDPIHEEAAATLKEAASPTFGSITPDGAVNGTRLAYYAGYCDAFRDLRKLTVIQPDKPNRPEEWTHIQP
tara:strand:+ start:1150 stop:1443 length:294 start_codon:yes stop_codon:yes gene_type:complete